MAKKNTENQAEVYRQKRKERLKKKQQRMAKRRLSPKAQKIIGRTVRIVVAAAASIAVLVGLLNFFGVPNKLTTVMTVGDEKINVVEYAYYYLSIYSQYKNTSQQYDSDYGSGMGKLYTGFDANLMPADQTTKNDEDQEITFEQLFADYVKDHVKQYKTVCDKARQEGFEISEEGKAEVDEIIESYRKQAQSVQGGEYSLNRFLSVVIISGMNEKTLRKILTEQTLYEEYMTAKQDEFRKGITEAEIEKEYKDNRTEYDKVSLRLFGFEIEDEDDKKDDKKDEDKKDDKKEEEKAPTKAELKAKEFLSKIKDEASFLKLAEYYYDGEDKDEYNSDDNTKVVNVDYDTVKANVSEEAAKWLFSTDRKVGDKAAYASSDYWYILYITSPAGRDEVKPVNVRHILIKFEDTDKDGKKIELTDEKKAEYKKKAEDIYNEFLNGDKTEQSFAALAEKYSDDKASLAAAGSTEGGLISNMERGQYVKQFENWAFDPSRKPGDTEIIETTYGYHIMYFVSTNEEPAWRTTAKDTISSEKTQKFFDDMMENSPFEIVAEDKAVKRALKRINKKIAEGISASARTSA
ncbi:MAG TPA: peptidylprolyl isomerase [Clostridiales bacterium]|nr:peptidylprolyl isomerase [Clostridiales bacterium]HXK83848.1 peptidylprolyl isomerase [Clostridiales bacterium]